MRTLVQRRTEVLFFCCKKDKILFEIYSLFGSVRFFSFRKFVFCIINYKFATEFSCISIVYDIVEFDKLLTMRTFMADKLFVRSLTLIAMFLFLGNSLFAQLYRLEKVSVIDSEGMYVFEQEGRVFTVIKNTYLQTTDSYATSNLTGNEPYVWTLEQKSGGFYMKNMSEVANPSDKIYMQSIRSSADLSYSRKTDASVWTFTPQTDGTFLIQVPDNSNRFLGLADDNVSYHAYAMSYLEYYEHAISAYRLVLEKTKGDVNTDGRVDISDVTSMIDIILGLSVEDDNYLATADLTDDGVVDISDVTALIDVILGKKQ